MLRPYRTSDARQVVELINASALLTLGARRAAVDALGDVRLSRYVPSAAERVVAVNARSEIVAYSYLTERDHWAINEVGGAVHPEWWGQGIGTLLAWAEERADARAPRGQGCRVVLQTNLFDTETAALELVRERGFRPLRKWMHLACELRERPPAPQLPDGFQIRPMNLDDDWDAVGPAMNAAFAQHWGAIIEPELSAEHDDDGAGTEAPAVDQSYSNTPGFCFVLSAGETVIGGVLCNAKLVERDDSGRIGSLFVHPRYQRRGLGHALMLSAYSAFWERGFRRLVVDTDAESFSGTPRFYAALGMREYRREWLYEREIRPGREVRRLTR